MHDALRTELDEDLPLRNSRSGDERLDSDNAEAFAAVRALLVAEERDELDALKAEQSEVVAALDDLESDVSIQEAKLADARAAADAARLAARRSQELETSLSQRALVVQDQLASLGVNAYVGGEDSANTLSGASTGTPSETAVKRTVLGLLVGDAVDLGEELRTIRLNAAEASLERLEASESAEALQAEIDGRLGEVKTARDRQAAFAADVSDRLDRRLAEAAVLADNDAALSRQISQSEAAVAQRLASSQSRSVAAPSGPTSVAVVGSGEIRTVGGIQIHQSISGNLASLLSAARSDGVNLAGWGYRSSDRQVQLRRQNCGSSNYAVYQMSSSRCRPPTARPGRSNHERGLAVDFTYNGGSISSRGSRGYQWLAANAARFGFYNLPSEPWHWSVNGK